MLTSLETGGLSPVTPWETSAKLRENAEVAAIGSSNGVAAPDPNSALLGEGKHSVAISSAESSGDEELQKRRELVINAAPISQTKKDEIPSQPESDKEHLGSSASFATGTSSEQAYSDQADMQAAGAFVSLAPAPFIAPTGVPAAQTYSTATYPYDAVCYILTDIAGGVQGSGAIIGPHTILTCSHLLWDYQDQSEANQISIYPGYSNGGTPIATNSWQTHFYEISYSEQNLPPSQTQWDFAVIDVAEDLSSFGSFGITTGYAGGTVHVTGYPAIANGFQNDQVGTVTADPVYSDLDYGSVSVHPGNSGGPLWIDTGSNSAPQPGAPAVSPSIVGLVSSSGYAVQLTSDDWNTIQGWEAADSYLWTSHVAAPAILFQNVSTGDTGYWQIRNGAGAGWVDLGGSNSAYHAVTTGNLYGTGTSEIIFQNANTGDTGYWNMSNGVSAGWVDLGGSNSAYHVIAAADFLGTGTSDILFQNIGTGDTGYWKMSNGSPVGWVDLGGSNSVYHAVAAGDFFGDGTSDVLFQNSSTGDTGYWRISNGVSAGWVDLGGSNNAYHAVATGDFFGGGTDDILFENIFTGDVGYWQMSNGVAIGFHDLGGSNNAYSVGGTGDLLGNGTSDIVFQNSGSGDTGYWRISNGVSTDWVDLGGSNNAYHVVGTGTF